MEENHNEILFRTETQQLSIAASTAAGEQPVVRYDVPRGFKIVAFTPVHIDKGTLTDTQFRLTSKNDTPIIQTTLVDAFAMPNDVPFKDRFIGLEYSEPELKIQLVNRTAIPSGQTVKVDFIFRLLKVD